MRLKIWREGTVLMRTPSGGGAVKMLEESPFDWGLQAVG